MTNNNINEYDFKNEILEIEMGPNGEFDEQTRKFIIEKCQEAVDENIWYTQEEAMELLDKMIEETKQCIELNFLKEQ